MDENARLALVIEKLKAHRGLLQMFHVVATHVGPEVASEVEEALSRHRSTTLTAALTSTAGPGPYGLAQKGKLPPASPLLPRGAVCPAVVNEMAIPATENLLDPREFSPALAFYYEHCKQQPATSEPGGPTGAAVVPDLHGPGPGKPAALRQLAACLWRAGCMPVACRCVPLRASVCLCVPPRASACLCVRLRAYA